MCSGHDARVHVGEHSTSLKDTAAERKAFVTMAMGAARRSEDGTNPWIQQRTQRQPSNHLHSCARATGRCSASSKVPHWTPACRQRDLGMALLTAGQRILESRTELELTSALQPWKPRAVEAVLCFLQLLSTAAGTGLCHTWWTATNGLSLRDKSWQYPQVENSRHSARGHLIRDWRQPIRDAHCHTRLRRPLGNSTRRHTEGPTCLPLHSRLVYEWQANAKYTLAR